MMKKIYNAPNISFLKFKLTHGIADMIPGSIFAPDGLVDDEE